MTGSRQSYSLEGELVRDIWDYEYDDLEIGGVNLTQWIEGVLGQPRWEDESPATRKGHFGRVRLTIEVL